MTITGQWDALFTSISVQNYGGMAQRECAWRAKNPGAIRCEGKRPDCFRVHEQGFMEFFMYFDVKMFHCST